MFTKYAPLRYQLITPYSLARFVYYKTERQFKEPQPATIQDIMKHKNVAWVFLWGTGSMDYAVGMFPPPPIANVVIRKNGVIYQPLPKDQFTPTTFSVIGILESQVWAFPLDLFSKEGDFEIIAVDTQDHQKPLKISADDMLKYK